MFSLFDILPDHLDKITLLDIGAFADGEDRYAALTEHEKVHVLGVEPSPDARAELEAIKGERFSCLPCFLGDGKDATVHITRFPGCISLIEPDGDYLNLFTSIGAEPETGNFAVLETETVQTTRLDDVPDVPSLQYIKADTQGTELMILENGTRVLSDTLVVEVEAEFLPLYKDQPLFGDLQLFMRDQGFVLHKFVDVAGRTLRPNKYAENPFAATSQLLWADAIFVRDFARLETYKDDDLLVAALLLHDIYASYDLVFYLLTEYDRRTGATLLESFFNLFKEVPREDRPRFYMNLKEQC